jgi:transcription termination factor Rho
MLEQDERSENAPVDSVIVVSPPAFHEPEEEPPVRTRSRNECSEGSADDDIVFPEDKPASANGGSDEPDTAAASFSASEGGDPDQERAGFSDRDDYSGDNDGGGRFRRRRRRRRRGRGGQDGESNRGQQGQRDFGGGNRGYNQQRGYGQQRGYNQQRGEFGQRNNGFRSRGDEIAPDEQTVDFEGVLELHPKGYGFLRDAKKSYCSQESDPFVSSSLIEKNGLREGVKIFGKVGMGARGQGPRLKLVENIDGLTVEEYANIKKFDDLTPITPNSRIRMEIGPKPITMRVMDLLTPIGRGQRALIVAPPRTGKTMLLQEIAESVSRNHPDMHLIVLLIDERPEEVTEMRRHVRGEVVASSLDSETESHVRISQLIVERAKRLAEEGKNVFILMDSITRAARAFNKWTNTGRTATGGLDVRALDIPKKMFGSARQFEEGGSLTIVATALIDTGSRADEAIFQEFKGTGNMELVLSRDLADRRIWPAIDITKSGTRHEEKLYDPHQFESIVMLRRSLISLSPVEAMEMLTRTLERFPTNAEFLEKVKSVL